MAEILKEWLTERLQRNIQWEAKDFGQIMKNGHIIASVLLSYHVINEEQYFLIRDSIASADISNNWKYLSQWLRDLDVCLSEADLNNIQGGKGSSLLRLFYQLFLHLDKKDRTNFIKRERKMVSSLVKKLSNRFKVDKVDEEQESFVDDLSRPLLNERHFIEWQRKKTEQMKETYDYIRHKYSKMLAKIEESKIPVNYIPPKPPKQPSKEKREMEKFAMRYPCKYQNYTYEELVTMDEKSTERKNSLAGSDWTRDYMENLYERMQKKTDSQEFQKQLKNTISGSLWDMSVAEEETELDTQLAKKVLKLSQFEKQMCTQIMETKQQARNLVKNRVHAEKEFSDQRDLQFNQFLDNVKDQIHLEAVEIDFEKQRQSMLHERLYAEKMKRKRQHYYEICYEAMLSLIDYATKYAYFKRLIGDDIPEHYIHEWKNLFFRKQAIFDILDPMEELLKQQGLEEEPVQEVEEIVRLELDRQNVINDEEFIEYNEYLHPWNLNSLLSNFDMESEERRYEYLGGRILGHMIYTLLEIKYPFPPPRPPADLPNYSSKAVIRGLPDKSITVPMQTLLQKSKIHVVRLECAINYCLREFKYDMVGCTDIELNFDKFIAASQEDEDKEFIRTLKTEDDAHAKSSDMAYSAATLPLPPNTKQTQTPKTIPEEEIKLSAPAELGKYAYEALSFGDTLTDHLLAAMIVEYLKDQDGINGFVIINYPNTYRETQILEDTLSGQEPPTEEELLVDRDDIYLEETIGKHRKKIKDPFSNVRISKLVKDPHKKRTNTKFQSYFSCYIKLIETEDILQEFVIWDLNEENSELIDRFYAVLGLNYSMYYEVIEKELLAQICKYIIGDLSVPLKSCDTLFGESIYSQLDFPLSEAKKTRSKIIKPEVSAINAKSKDKVRSKLKMSKSNMSMTAGLEVVKSPESLEDLQDEPIAVAEQNLSEEHETKSVATTEEVKILAGEEDWDYGEIPISDIVGGALATCWEEVEKTYVHDIGQLFFAKRLQMNCLVPYSRFIKDRMEQIITLPSYKQDIVSRFQKNYNDFEDDWRDVNLTKNEWHCRVKELQHKLYNICDERKLFAETQRQALIGDNWALEELTTMANTYISCMQTELNRYYLTLQALHDFYFAMLKRLPPNERISASKELPKIARESDDPAASKKGDKEDKHFKQLKSVYQDMLMKNITIEYHNNPFNSTIENNVKLAQKLIKDSNDYYRSIISKEYSEVAKIVVPVKKKEDNSSEETTNAEEIFKSNALKCVDEWIMGINGEMYRANQRMLVLQAKCYIDMKLFNDHIFKSFIDIQNDIDTYYINEINSVDRLCKYIQMAIENGRKIPESLVLEHDTFVIDPNLLQLAPREAPPETPEGVEIVDDITFKICQLARLRTQLKIVAPTGLALQQAFIYLLQDFILFGKESCEGTLFPEIWRRVDPEQVPKLVLELFGETAYVDWKDFLIYCINIRFPTIYELLDLRHRFRCNDLQSTELISRDDFLNETLWFESDFPPEDRLAQLRKMRIKHFIFELYETSEDMMNYPAFLLAFCKSPNPIEGFASALSMATGKIICHSFDECEEVVCNLIKYKLYKDECLACALKCTNEFLTNVINKVIDVCVGTTLSEVPYTEIDDKKAKAKGKGKGKGKETQSARLPRQKSATPSFSKVTQSAVDVKTTFICPPCEEPPAPEEKPPEKEEVEEEEHHEVLPDPNIDYAVAQGVIWKVLRICLPWHFVLVPEAQKTPYIQQVRDAMDRLAVNHNEGHIYISMFVMDPKVCVLLHKVKKFQVLNVAEEVRKICT